MTTKTKQILFQVELEGEGIVNYDSVKQASVYFKYDNTAGVNKRTNNKNVKFAKKNFYLDADNKLHEKIKISRDALMKTLYNDNIVSHIPSISIYDRVFYNYLSAPASIMRGWLFADSTDGLKRKGCITLTDAEQTSNTVSQMETYSKPEYREKKVISSEEEDADDRGNTNFFTSESCGDITYRADGAIDLEFLQFISADPIFDRYNINPDKFDLFKEYYEQRFGKSDIKLDYYQTNTSIIDMSEYGILLPEEHVKIMVKDFFERLTKLNIQKRGAHARVKSIKIKLVNNPLVDTMSSEDGWIDLSGVHIDEVQYSVHNFYKLRNSDEHIKQNKEHLEKLKEKNDLDKEIKRAENAKKKASKDKKTDSKK